MNTSRGNDGLTGAERAELAERYAQRATLTESDTTHIKKSREDAGPDGRSDGWEVRACIRPAHGLH